MWEHLTKTAQDTHTFDNLTNVKEIMNAWTTKMGFPVVNVTRNYSTNNIEFAQSRFTFIAPSQWKSLQIKYDEALWWIPLSYTTATEADFNNTKPKNWIRGTEKFAKDFENITNDDWIIVNIQGTGNFILFIRFVAYHFFVFLYKTKKICPIFYIRLLSCQL